MRNLSGLSIFIAVCAALAFFIVTGAAAFNAIVTVAR